MISSHRRWPQSILLLLLVLALFGTARSLVTRGDSAMAGDESNRTEAGRNSTTPFSLAVLDLPLGYQAMRWNCRTGAAWSIHNNTLQWIPAKEPKPIPSGRYEIKFASWKKDNSPVFVALRFDAETGSTWYLNNGEWSLLKEPPAPE